MTTYPYPDSYRQQFTVPDERGHTTRQQVSVYAKGAKAQNQESEEQERITQMLLTVPQVAQQLGICRAHVYKLINLGLPTIHLGRSVRVSSQSLQQWLKEQEEKM